MEETFKEILNTLNQFDWISFLLSLITILVSISALGFTIYTNIKVAKIMQKQH